MSTPTSPSSPSGGQSIPSHPDDSFDQHDFVLYIDIFLLCIVALFFLSTLPGAVVRFSQLPDWSEGMFFRKVVSLKQFSRSPSSSSDGPAPIVSSTSSPGVTVSQSKENAAGKHESSLVACVSQVNEVRRFSTENLLLRQSQNPPVHMAAWSSILPLVHKVLAHPVRPRYSVGKALLLLVYTGVMLFAGFYQTTPFSNPQRAGVVFASQVPFVITLATKNNIIGWLVGYGYEKLNYLHRLVGRFAILAVNVHGIGYMFTFTSEGSFWERLAGRPNVAWGFVGLVAADVLFLLSTSIVRELCYPVFYVSHILMTMVFLGSLCVHESWAIPYVVAAAAIYVFDRILRIVRSRYTVANLYALPELRMTRIEVPAVNAGWRAGQHVRIKVLSLGMGWLGWAETHPFTIASVSQASGDEGLVLMCKQAGDWTGKLLELAKRTDRGEANGSLRSVRVIIDGPYGGPGNSILSSYSGAMFVVGGSGVTYALASVQELLYRAAEGKTRVKVIELVWSIRDPSFLVPFLPLFTNLLAESENTSTHLRITVSYTRLPSSEALVAVQTLPPGLTLSGGRPKLGKLLEDVVERTCSLHSNECGSVGSLTGVVAGVCGPLALGEDLAKAVRGIPAADAKAVGGIELHEETFGW
ncbi:incomplete iron reductase [Amylocystis lapponica]|nr:incomplete iron reductase [Amylocystis lapponica]